MVISSEVGLAEGVAPKPAHLSTGTGDLKNVPRVREFLSEPLCEPFIHLIISEFSSALFRQ